MIIIDDKYAIETDSMGNYSLFRRKTAKKGKKAGEEIRDYVGHFNTLRGAVKSYVCDRFNSETQDMEISLSDAVKRLEAIENDAISKFGF
jgi:hypothetical protein